MPCRADTRSGDASAGGESEPSAPAPAPARPRPTTGSAAFDPVERLDREWQRLARDRLLRTRLRTWTERESALARFTDPRDLIRFLRLRGDWKEKDAVLGALLRLAPVDALAGRVLLEAVLPGLKRVAERVILDSRDREELWQLLLVHLWKQICSYPLERRSTRIAANLLLETRRAALAEFAFARREQIEVTTDLFAVPAARESGGDVEVLLDDAVAAGAITRDEAELILQTRIDGVTLASLASAGGIAYHTLKVRRIRAERRLFFYLGYSAVTFRHRNAHCLGARVAG